MKECVNGWNGPFFGGRNLALEDITLIPYLYHMEVVGAELRVCRTYHQKNC